MSKITRLHKGLNIKLRGGADTRVEQMPPAASHALCFDDFPGVTPKMLVKAGDKVKAGTPLFFDKARPEILFSSPVSGTVAEVVRGDKRKLIAVVITPDPKQAYEEFKVPAAREATRESVAKAILEAGLWPFIIQRPYGVIASPADSPKAIFISGFDTAPLAPDLSVTLEADYDNLLMGIEMLKKLTPGYVRISLDEDGAGVLHRLYNAEQHYFSGPHPAGNVGVQIHHIDPVNKGETVWTVSPQGVAIIGRLFNTGKVDMSKRVAVTGSEVVNTHYASVIAGAAIDSIIPASNIAGQKDGGTVRVISGNVLTGTSVDRAGGYLRYYDNQVTVIPEGDHYELLGWAMPRMNKFSVSRTFFSWLMPWKRYTLDTNLNGGERPFVITGLYEKYLPMDIYPMYLLKAALAGDIDKMENLGIYEVVEEDIALCEFVDPSKTEMQQILRDGINLIIKELS